MAAINLNDRRRDVARDICRIYEVTEDTFLLAQGLPYITKDQEEAIPENNHHPI